MDENEGWLKVNVIESQNVPFESSSVQIETEGDTFNTTYEPSKFPKFNQSYKFYNLRRDDIVRISKIGETSEQRLVGALQIREFEDQKLHDKWITLADAMTDRLTDVKVRLIIHYVYSPIPLCEEAILGWENHLSNLKYNSSLLFLLVL